MVRLTEEFAGTVFAPESTLTYGGSAPASPIADNPFAMPEYSPPPPATLTPPAIQPNPFSSSEYVPSEQFTVTPSPIQENPFTSQLFIPPAPPPPQPIMGGFDMQSNLTNQFTLGQQQEALNNGFQMRGYEDGSFQAIDPALENAQDSFRASLVMENPLAAPPPQPWAPDVGGGLGLDLFSTPQPEAPIGTPLSPETIGASTAGFTPTGGGDFGDSLGGSLGGGMELGTNASDLRAYAREVAQKYGLDPAMFEAQIQQESGFRLGLTSSAGAQGIAQFIPSTAASYGVNVNDPYSSLEGAARMMRDLMDQFGGDIRLALAAYNAGPGAVEKYGGVPPFEETQNYVRNITNARGSTGAGVSADGLGPSWSRFSISQGFGPTDEPLDSGYAGYAHFNKGLDFAMPVGTPIDSPVSGTVVRVETDPNNSSGWGKLVWVRDASGRVHNFGHLSGTNVAVGQQVNAGDVIGLSGNTGKSTGPHLSYDVMDPQGNFIDPSGFIGGQTARTLTPNPNENPFDPTQAPQRSSRVLPFVESENQEMMDSNLRSIFAGGLEDEAFLNDRRRVSMLEDQFSTDEGFDQYIRDVSGETAREDELKRVFGLNLYNQLLEDTLTGKIKPSETGLRVEMLSTGPVLVSDSGDPLGALLAPLEIGGSSVLRAFGDEGRMPSLGPLDDVPGLSKFVDYATSPFSLAGFGAGIGAQGLSAAARQAATRGLPAIGLGVAGENIGNEIGGTPGAILGGVAGGLLGWNAPGIARGVRDVGENLPGMLAREAGDNPFAATRTGLQPGVGAIDPATGRPFELQGLMGGADEAVEGFRRPPTQSFMENLQRTDEIRYVNLRDLTPAEQVRVRNLYPHESELVAGQETPFLRGEDPRNVSGRQALLKDTEGRPSGTLVLPPGFKSPWDEAVEAAPATPTGSRTSLLKQGDTVTNRSGEQFLVEKDFNGTVNGFVTVRNGAGEVVRRKRGMLLAEEATPPATPVAGAAEPLAPTRIGETPEATNRAALDYLDEHAALRKSGVTQQEIHEGRINQLESMQRAMDEADAQGLKGAEHARFVLDAQKGHIIRTLPEALPEETIGNMWNTIHVAIAEAGANFNANVLRRAMWKVETEAPLTPKEAEELRKVFGDEIVDNFVVPRTGKVAVENVANPGTTAPLAGFEELAGTTPPLLRENPFGELIPEQPAAGRVSADTPIARFNPPPATGRGMVDVPGSSGPPLSMSPQPSQLPLREVTPEMDADWRAVTGKIAPRKPITVGQMKGFMKQAGIELLTLPRALKSGLDISAPGRQGIMLFAAHPIKGAQATKKMLQAWKSEETFLRHEKMLDTRPNARVQREAELFRAKLSDDLNEVEEAFISKMAGKIPIIKRGERAYVAFLNEIRASTFDQVWDSLPPLGQTAENAKTLAAFINSASGRGSLPGALSNSGKLLSMLFFAPRYLISRPESIYRASHIALTGPKAMRGEAMRVLASYFGGVSAFLALGEIAGAWDVEWDPRSGRWGKLTVEHGGNTFTLDPWAGHSQIGRAVARFTTGTAMSARTGSIYDVKPGDVLADFARTKLSPLVGEVVNQLQGKDFIGNDIKRPYEDPLGFIKRLYAPIAIEDIQEGVAADGWFGAMMSLPNFIGIGASVIPATTIDKLDEAAGRPWYDWLKDDRKGAMAFLEKPENAELKAAWDAEQAKQLQEGRDVLADNPETKAVAANTIEVAKATREKARTEAIDRFGTHQDGKTFRQELETLEAEYRGALNATDESFQIFNRDGTLPDDPLKAAEVQWYSLFDKAPIDKETGRPDFEWVEAEREKLRQTFSAEQNAHIEAQEAENFAALPPELQDLKTARERIAETGWFALEEGKLQKLRDDPALAAEIVPLMKKYGYSEMTVQAWEWEQEATAAQQADDAALAAGTMTVTQWEQRTSDRAVEGAIYKEAVYEGLPQEVVTVLDRYYSELEANKTRNGGFLDFDEMAKWEAANPAETAAFESRPVTGLTPKAIELRQVSRDLQGTGYWDLTDQVWTSMTRNYPEYHQYETYNSYVDAWIEDRTGKLVAQGLSQEAASRRAEMEYQGTGAAQAVSEAKNEGLENQWVQDNPELAWNAWRMGRIDLNRQQIQYLSSMGYR